MYAADGHNWQKLLSSLTHPNWYSTQPSVCLAVCLSECGSTWPGATLPCLAPTCGKTGQQSTQPPHCRDTGTSTPMTNNSKEAPMLPLAKSTKTAAQHTAKQEVVGGQAGHSAEPGMVSALCTTHNNHQQPRVAAMCQGCDRWEQEKGGSACLDSMHSGCSETSYTKPGFAPTTHCSLGCCLVMQLHPLMTSSHTQLMTMMMMMMTHAHAHRQDNTNKNNSHFENPDPNC